MQDERLFTLITRHLTKEASAEEQEELYALLKDLPDQQYFVDLMKDYWKYKTPAEAANKELDARFLSILAFAKDDPYEITSAQTNSISRFKVKKILAGIAIAASILTCFILIYHQSQEPRSAQLASETPTLKNEVTSKNGVKSRLTLPDGTKVWLNADTKLTYGHDFNQAREINLEGEAFFDVAKNPDKPFVVHTSGIDIKVLGTTFNVKSYPLESTIEATLVQGQIEIVKKNEPSGPRILLRPHEKLTFNKKAETFSPSVSSSKPQQEILISSISKAISDTAIKETSWVYNKLIFDGDTFSELAVKMERWFNVTIRIPDREVANYRFKGMFEKESIDQALHALQITADFHYKIKDNEIAIFK